VLEVVLDVMLKFVCQELSGAHPVLLPIHPDLTKKFKFSVPMEVVRLEITQTCVNEPTCFFISSHILRVFTVNGRCQVKYTDHLKYLYCK
jgi:hypothetical protein